MDYVTLAVIENYLEFKVSHHSLLTQVGRLQPDRPVFTVMIFP